MTSHPIRGVRRYELVANLTIDHEVPPLGAVGLSAHVGHQPLVGEDLEHETDEGEDDSTAEEEEQPHRVVQPCKTQTR